MRLRRSHPFPLPNTHAHSPSPLSQTSKSPPSIHKAGGKVEKRKGILTRNSFPGAEIWVTEYAYAQRSLPEAQAFYNRSAAYLDASPRVARHSYFGAFRSSASDVGADVVLLSDGGEVTDIGAWYTGLGKAEGVRPESTRSGGSRRGGDSVRRAWWGVVVAAALAIAV